MQDGSEGFGAILRQYDERFEELGRDLRHVSAQLDATTRGMEAIVERLEQVELGQTAIHAGREQ